ncbi:hypothetical protein PP2015_872 [Pseudoalteromonas phenolica]|uniref:Uncharacterized protein n=1 Tax=Pseudoalteromonas phenolica TaxID=161398 RepID=A0A0S2K041_9GAMM|nr:hypothetical protein PP2015_872 [Pseudoalteromonas phenolica]MBE0354065.1 hypothetical protein [Pseudoalteromonas phenolica O-BC30]
MNARWDPASGMNVVQSVNDNERSEYACFAQERCKRPATVNEVNPLFLRKVK